MGLAKVGLILILNPLDITSGSENVSLILILNPLDITSGSGKSWSDSHTES